VVPTDEIERKFLIGSDIQDIPGKEKGMTKAIPHNITKSISPMFLSAYCRHQKNRSEGSAERGA